MAYQLVSYENQGKRPVEEFLLKLKDGNKQERKLGEKLLALIKLLGEQGLTLPFPYRSHVKGAIHELRGRYANLRGRVLFACERGEIVLLHGIIKNTAAMNLKDVALAEERWKRYIG